VVTLNEENCDIKINVIKDNGNMEKLDNFLCFNSFIKPRERTHSFINSKGNYHVLSNFQKARLGLIHTRHFDTQYCDKKIFLIHGFQ